MVSTFASISLLDDNQLSASNILIATQTNNIYRTHLEEQNSPVVDLNNPDE